MSSGNPRVCARAVKLVVSRCANRIVRKISKKRLVTKRRVLCKNAIRTVAKRC